MTNGIQVLFDFYDTPSFLAVNISGRFKHGLGGFEGIASVNGTEETGSITLVTGGADLLDLDEQRVAVAIERDIFYGLGVAAFLAFHPEFLAGAAPEMGFAGGDGFFEGSAIHPRHHQDAAGAGFLHNGGNEAVGVKFQFVVKGHFSSTQSKRKLEDLNEKVVWHAELGTRRANLASARIVGGTGRTVATVSSDKIVVFNGNGLSY